MDVSQNVFGYELLFIHIQNYECCSLFIHTLNDIQEA
jgi:hypothetical protein